jgi:CheY-like chemotaxis protein
MRAGFEVVIAADGEEALRRVAPHAPDLIVLDIPMLRTDGREGLRRRHKPNDLPR